MAVETTLNRIDYSGDGVSTVFAYNFLVYDATHFTVIRTSAAGVEATLVQPTDYSVSGVGVPAGGNVTLVSPLLVGEKLAILRVVPVKQTASYPVGNKFPSSTHERVVDLLTMIGQQITETFGRALKLKTGSTQKDKVIDDLVALKHLRVKADASGLEMVDAPAGTVSFPITTGQGGLGQDVSAGAAEGDILVRSAGLVFAALAKAARGAILRTTATTVSYLAKGARGALLSYDANDVITTPAGTKGQMLLPDANADLGWQAIGADGTVPVYRAGATRGVEAAKVGSYQHFTGLVAGTHPDADKLATTVAVRALKSATMSDGTRYDDVVVPGTDAMLEAAITGSGLGGLDTGAEAASTWYSYRLVGKSGTKAKSDLRLVLHREKDFFKDQEQATIGTAQLFRDNAARTKMAQGVQFATAGKFEAMEVRIRKIGAATGEFWVELQSDNAGNPSGTVLATSEKWDVSRLDSASNKWYWMIFRAPATVATGTQYHIVYRSTVAISGAVHLEVPGTTPTAYANGSAKQADGADVWSAASTIADFGFRLYVTRNDTALTFPTDYDQECLLGYIFNNSGSNFERTNQKDRRIELLWSTFFNTAGQVAHQLNDVTTRIPPVPVTVFWQAVDSSGAANLGAMWGVPHFVSDLTSGSSIRRNGGSVTYMAAGNAYVSGGEPFLTEFQRIYISLAAGWDAHFAAYEF